MPSSPGPSEYKRQAARFFYKGISLMPQDALPAGKLAYCANIRSYEEGTIEVRYGLDPFLTSAFASPIHTLARLNDTTPFGVADPAARFYGVGTALYAGGVTDPAPAVIDTGYSGNPLTTVPGDAFRTPRPFLYVADEDRQRKFDSSLNSYSWGLPTPRYAPDAVLVEPQLTVLDAIDGGNWEGYGPNVTPVPPIPVVDRINTTVTYIFYDDGSTNTGMASVGVADWSNFTPGCRPAIGAAPEAVVVQSIHPPVASTTIDAILYDSGTTGWASIQLTGGLSVGQIEGALKSEYDGRHHIGDDPDVPRVTVTRTVDFPVNSLIVVGGVETVPIRSIAVGPDGVTSIRVVLTGTYAAGATITGAPSFRAWFNTTKAVGDPVVEKAIEVTLTPTTTGDPDIGGFQATVTASPRDWGFVGNRATTPDDIIRLGIKVSDLAFVEFIRIMLDVDVGAVTPFSANYYVYEWRAADLVAAIQSTSEATTSSFVDGQSTAVERGQTQSIYSDQYGQGQVGSSDPVVGRTTFGSAIRARLTRMDRPAASADDWTPTGRTWARRAIQRLQHRQSEAAKAAAVVAGASISRQLALGNDVWMTLECRVSDLTRIGTRTDLNLTTVTDCAVYAQVIGSTAPIDLQMTAVYLYGGYGPDVGTTLAPYVYRYSYRSTLTGERSNTSPSMRAGVRPIRGRVELTAQGSSEAQCDAVDFWRFGGALAQWTYVGTGTNDPTSSPLADVTFLDDMADGQIDGGPTPRVDLFQPWPTTDLPRSGTCRIAGTSVEWLSGDVFNPSWSADTLITINGRTTSLYGQPSSTTRLEVVDNVGSGDVAFSIPAPLLVSQPLPAVWGGLIADTLLLFACGDPNDPGNLHWTNANDPDSSSDANIIAVCPASEPLLNGFMDDGHAYVFSTERLFSIVPSGDPISPIRVVETACTTGLWSRYFFAVDPAGGVYFGNKQGIFGTKGGSEAVPITSPDLQPLFPHDGSQPESIRNLAPIDFTQTDRLRLSVVGSNLYFDYVDINGIGHSFLYEPIYQRWTPDSYFEDATASPPTTSGAVIRISEPGPQVLNHLIACEDGQLYTYTINKTTDNLADIPWAVWTPWPNGEDPRAYKQWGDAILDMNPAGSQDGIQVTPVLDNGNVALTPQIVGAGVSVRDTFTIELASGGVTGYGPLSRNFGLLIEGSVQACDINRPILYLWEVAQLWKGTAVGYRATDWEDLGYKGSKFIQGIVIRANTFGQQKLVNVEFDGPAATPSLAMTLSLLHDGEQTIAYPQVNTGWQPFLAELVRLRGVDDVPWTLLDWRWVFEPAPEAATQWETQDTTFDFPGFFAVVDMVVAYAAPSAVTLVVTHDQTPISYTLPATTGGDYLRTYLRLGAYKGKSVNFQWSSDLPFRLYKRDMSVRVQPWGVPGGFRVENPFGGESRIDGAGI